MPSTAYSPSRKPAHQREQQDETSGDEEDALPSRSQSRNARRRNRKRQQGSGLPAVDEVENTMKQVSSLAEGATGAVGKAGGGDKDKEKDKDALGLKLDLNLDVYLKLKVKVHGDLTLTLLG